MRAASAAYGFRSTFILGTTLLAIGCASPSPALPEIAALPRAPLHTFSELEIDRYLRWLSDQDSTAIQRVVKLARQSVGQPYRLGLLGEFPFELHDSDPLYCLSASDCVTFVEQTFAMALAGDWPFFVQTLQRIRYRDGVIGLRSRNHFMEADWNVNNAWLFEDVTATLGGRAEVKPMQTRIDRAALLARHGVSADVPIQVWEDSYVPRKCLPAAWSALRDGDLVEIVKGNDEWQYVSHVGIVLHDSVGRPTIIHATPPAVREESLEDYLAGHPELLGLKFLRLRYEWRSPLPVASGSDMPSPDSSERRDLSFPVDPCADMLTNSGGSPVYGVPTRRRSSRPWRFRNETTPSTLSSSRPRAGRHPPRGRAQMARK